MSYGFSLATTVVLLVNYGLSVSQSFLFAQPSLLRCKKQLRETTTTSSISNLVVLLKDTRNRERKTMGSRGLCVNKNAKGTLSLPVPLLFGLKANA